MDMSPLTLLIEPRLPQELEHIIFTIAARNERRDIRALMQVARRVFAWLEPILFEVVVVYTRRRNPRGTPNRTIYDLPRFPSGPQVHHVQHLLYENWPADGLSPSWGDLIPQCHNLQSVGFWASSLPNTALSDLTSIIQSPLRTVSHGLVQISGDLQKLFPRSSIDFNHVVFKDITHLEIDAWSGPIIERWQQGNNFGCLKKLRYLCFSMPSILKHTVTILKCLEACETLELLVILTNALTPKAADMPITKLLPKTRRKIIDGRVKKVPEDRLVFVPSPVVRSDFFTDWCNRAIGGESIWKAGERIVEERRRRRNVHTGSVNEVVA